MKKGIIKHVIMWGGSYIVSMKDPVVTIPSSSVYICVGMIEWWKNGKFSCSHSCTLLHNMNEV